MQCLAAHSHVPAASARRRAVLKYVGCPRWVESTSLPALEAAAQVAGDLSDRCLAHSGRHEVRPAPALAELGPFAIKHWMTAMGLNDPLPPDDLRGLANLGFFVGIKPAFLRSFKLRTRPAAQHWFCVPHFFVEMFIAAWCVRRVARNLTHAYPMAPGVFRQPGNECRERSQANHSQDCGQINPRHEAHALLPDSC